MQESKLDSKELVRINISIFNKAMKYLDEDYCGNIDIEAIRFGLKYVSMDSTYIDKGIRSGQIEVSLLFEVIDQKKYEYACIKYEL